MPSTTSLVSFALVVGLVTITPGLDTALVVRSALSRGRVDAAVTAAGITLGVLVWAAAAATGLSALMVMSNVAYDLMRAIGAGYMVLLGVRMLRSAGRGRVHPVDSPQHQTTRWDAFRTGLLTNLLNPKVGAFYVALLPQFIPDSGSQLLSGLVLGLVHGLEGAVWFTALILGAGTMRRYLTRRSTERWVEGITGMALVGFGLKLAFARSR